MIYATWFDRIPLLVVFVLTVAFTLVAIAVGMRLSALARKSADDKAENSVGSVVGATLALLAFVLAFTFGMTANRFDNRKQLLLDEVNAIGTAFLRAGLLPQPHQADVRKQLREYVDLRARLAREPESLEEVVARSEAIQDSLWKEVEEMTARTPASVVQGLFVQSLNEVIDLQAKRVVVGLQYRVPPTIWFGLYGVAALAMVAVGYQFGQSRRFPIVVSVILAMAFSAVMTLIADLDRAGSGTVQVSHQPVLELQKKLHASP